MILGDVQKRFILHWGEMGTRWGINRTVAQIHALLYLSAQPLTAEDIAETLSVARSNVSTSLRELQSWKIVKVIHVMGDRRDHFETMEDVWELFRVIMDERKRREIDPTLELLRACMDECDKDKRADEFTRARLGNMLEFIETTTQWYGQMMKLPNKTLVKFIRLGAKVPKLLGLAS